MTQELNRLIENLTNAGHTDKLAFCVLLNRAIDLLVLCDETLAREFDVSRPTVVRWRNGSHAPLQAMRPIVYRQLVRLAKRVC